jgi:hypothetical protein
MGAKTTFSTGCQAELKGFHRHDSPKELDVVASGTGVSLAPRGMREADPDHIPMQRDESRRVRMAGPGMLQGFVSSCRKTYGRMPP